MTEPPVLVVIPAFNAEATLAAAVSSALTDQEKLASVVVVDDGSTDGTLEVAKSFGPMVQVLAGPNCGVSHARNRALATGRGDWILFLDADDLLAPYTIPKRLAAAPGADVVVTDWVEFPEHENLFDQPRERRRANWDRLRRDGAEAATAVAFWAAISAILYRRTILESVGGFRAGVALLEDAQLLFDVAAHGASFSHSPHIGTGYRQRAGSASRQNAVHFWLASLQKSLGIEARWRAEGSLPEARRRALEEGFGGALSALLRLGRPEAREALGGLRRAGGRPGAKERAGLALLAAAGGRATAAAFRAGLAANRLRRGER